MKHLTLKLKLHYSCWDKRTAKKLIKFPPSMIQATRNRILNVINDLNYDDHNEGMTIFKVLMTRSNKHLMVFMEDPGGQGSLQVYATKGQKFKGTVGMTTVFDDDFDLDATVAEFITDSDKNLERRPFGCGY